jgi:hypothetical protein
VIGREFWETWVDEKAQKNGGAAPAEGSAPAASTAEPAEPAEARRERRPRREREAVPPEEPGFVRLYVNVGKRESLGSDEISKLIIDAAPDHAASVGRVTVLPTHTYVAVKEESADALVAAMAGKKVGERELVVERAKK